MALRDSCAARAPSPPEKESGVHPVPRIDDRLAPPETRIEYLDGKKILSMPADSPHATYHSQLDAVLRAHAGARYTVAVDMLTRTSPTSDFAPDVSIFPSAPDPKTKGRRLEELAFEVASKQRLKVPTDKARKLIQRGVRRVFCVLVKQRRVLEWSAEADGWATVLDAAVITDRCLVRPLPVAALLDAARVDDEMAEALLVKRPPAIRRALSESEEKGRRAGELQGALRAKAEAVVKVLEKRGIKVSPAVRATVMGSSDAAELDGWLDRAFSARTAAAVVKKA
jgi:hypothetical protein